MMQIFTYTLQKVLSNDYNTERLSDASCIDLRIYPDTALRAIILTLRSYSQNNGSTLGNSVELSLLVETSPPPINSIEIGKYFYHKLKIQF